MIVILSTGQSWASIDSTVRKIIPTGSLQVGMITPTCGSSPRATGRGDGTRRFHEVTTVSTIDEIDKTVAASKGHATHGRS
jgi:hypothetical protein